MMDSGTFLAKVAEVLDHDGKLTKGQALDSVEVWDSLGILSVVDLLEELGADVDIDALSNIQTTDDLIVLAGSAVNDD
jgi:acyl carrier protein